MPKINCLKNKIKIRALSACNGKYDFTLKQFILIFFLAFAVSGIAVFIYKSTPVQEFFFDRYVRHDIVVRAPEGDIQTEVSDTSSSRELGLSFRKEMQIGEGMLFVFDTPGKYGFWMKDMNFPLDIIWLDKEGRVVYLVDSVAVSTFPGVFMNDPQAKYVLELNAGVASKLGIYLGTKLEIGTGD